MPSHDLIGVYTVARKHVGCSRQNLLLFCRSLYAVAVGLRTAHLLDIPISEEACKTLLAELRDCYVCYDNICFLREETPSQTFAINARLLRARVDRSLNDCTWISIRDGTFTELASAPSAVKRALQNTCDQLLDPLLPALVSIAICGASGNLVALAGFLLEYPAIYAPSDKLHFDNVTFSYPEALQCLPALALYSLQTGLLAKYAGRLKETTTEWTGVRIEWTVSDASISL